MALDSQTETLKAHELLHPLHPHAHASWWKPKKNAQDSLELSKRSFSKSKNMNLHAGECQTFGFLKMSIRHSFS